MADGAVRARPQGWRRWTVAAFLFSALTVLGLYVYYGAQRHIGFADSLASLDWQVLPVALGLHVLAHVFWAMRLSVVGEGVGTPLGGWTSFRLITAGVFGASITPGRVGGDGLRFALLQRGGLPAPAILRVLLADRGLDLVFFAIVGGLAVPVLPGLLSDDATHVRRLVWVGLAAATLLTALLMAFVIRPAPFRRLLALPVRGLERAWPRAGSRLRQAGATILDQTRLGMRALVAERPGILALATVLTLATWLAEFGIIWVLLKGFGHDVPFYYVFLAASLLNIVTSLPLTPGGSGIAEVGAMVLFAPMAEGLTPAFVLAWRALTYYYDLVVGAWFAARARRGVPAGAAPKPR